MKYEVRISDRKHVVEFERHADGWQARIENDESSASADVTEVAANVFSVLRLGRCHEIYVTPSPDGQLHLQTGGFEFTAEVIDLRSWHGRRHSGGEAQGRQQVAAPMPGKVVRLLVKAGDQVEVNQGLLVVEAMKMQNEIRSPKSGTVERLLVEEGQAVNAGEVLCIVG
jgi:biotin carboxyl carrier protein